MHNNVLFAVFFVLATLISPRLFAQLKAFDSIWSDPAINERIEKGIETYRKDDVTITILDRHGRPARNIPVKIEQTGHEFLFGSTLFMLDGFESEEQNRRFEEVFLSLFNHGSVPFYWKTLEPEQGNIRFEKDSEFIYRRPPPDAVLEFCQKHNIFPKGHPIVWDNQEHAYPDWLPDDEDNIWKLMERHIEKLAARYGRTIPVWDVVNELYNRHEHMTKPYDFGFRSFEKAASVFPPETQLVINDVTALWGDIKREYSTYYLIIENILLKGAKIDGIGLQCHFMQTQTFNKFLQGKFMHPRDIFKVMDTYAHFGMPLHITEITIPTLNTPYGEEIQARVTKNLYRIWFSHPNMKSIVWWNMVDNTAASGQDRWRGGFLDDNMQPKKSYHVLNRLINEDWKTRMETRSNNEGRTDFRGFYGEYTITAGTGKRSTKHVIKVLKGKENDFIIKL
jgi:endo-1,4-beta-xylanase